LARNYPPRDEGKARRKKAHALKKAQRETTTQEGREKKKGNLEKKVTKDKGLLIPSRPGLP